MIKNILYTIGILATIIVYYLFYEHQNKRFESIESKLFIIADKIDNISNDKPDNFTSSLDYKENNFIKDDIVNFSDSLKKIFDNDSAFKNLSLLPKSEEITSTSAILNDTFCFDLADQYKIINFYNNKIRIKNMLKPGSVLLSLNDSLIHNDEVYILKEINGKGSYIRLENLSSLSDCKFHKINPNPY
tara:strand:+ start:74 stop:637 length:564 start_codon:yes stop_codon:yes gene_type:complete